jgi:hypothetical protein
VQCDPAFTTKYLNRNDPANDKLSDAVASHFGS